MLDRQESERLYFSTKVDLKIDGVIYRPSICYAVPPFAKSNLEKNSNVTFYKERVRFVNGSVAPIIEEKQKSVPSVVQASEEKNIQKRKGR